ncbi:MAG: RDD family protein [Candidatus Dormiibacterota bacterium]
MELTEHHVQGRLSTEELSERSRLAFAAKTSGELNGLLADLPGRPRGPMTVWEGVRSLRTRGPFPGLGYLGFWPRAGALATDLVLVGAAGAVLQAGSRDLHLLFGAITLLQVGYFVVLWATTGKTVGLWLVGGRVVREEDGGRLGLGRSVVRMVGYVVDVATCCLGFAWAGVDRRKQAWHDKMAGSYVVRRLR